MSRFAGKVAVVTGASKGIGACIAKRLASEGARVVVNYASSQAAAEAVVAEIGAKGGEAIAVAGRIEDAAAVERLFAEAVRAFGQVDVLVNNAGIYRLAPLAALSEESYRAHFDTNVLGLLLASKAAASLFPASGGSIVNVSSIVSTAAVPENVLYVGTKGAVDAITRSLAAELGPRRIRVNAVNPGLVVTEGTSDAGIVGSEFEAGFVAQAALGRVGTPEDIAAAVAFLASDEASWITGETLKVAGGFGI